MDEDLIKHLESMRGGAVKTKPKKKITKAKVDAEPKEAKREKPKEIVKEVKEKPKEIINKEVPKEVERKQEVNKETDDLTLIIHKYSETDFKSLKGVFKNDNGNMELEKLEKSQISNAIKPMLLTIQNRLESKYVNTFINFPFGKYEVTDENKVFNNLSTLVRYLTIKELDLGNLEHVKYAKQWFMLNNPKSFNKDFNYNTDLKNTSDELDIYAIMILDAKSNFKSAEKLSFSAEDSYNNILSRIKSIEKRIVNNNRKSEIKNTILLLDRLGLLKGDLPRNINDLVLLIEDNKENTNTLDLIINEHFRKEDNRLKRLNRKG